MSYFSSKYELIQHFSELGYKVGAEIGVSQGFFSEALFKAIPGLKLYCVDAWLSYPECKRWMPNQARADTYYDITKKRLAPYNAVIMKEMSMDAVKKIPDGSLDFIFIDSNHKFDYVMQDLIEWSKKVRVGGMITGDDYFHFKGAGVVEAVDAYTKAHGIKFELTNPYPDKIQDRNTQEQPCFYWVK